jgi:predicted nucleotidyltransferase
MRLSVKEVRDVAVNSLLNRFHDNLEAVVLFGSYARGKPST